MRPVEGLHALDLLKAATEHPDLIQRPEGGRPERRQAMRQAFFGAAATSCAIAFSETCGSGPRSTRSSAGSWR